MAVTTETARHNLSERDLPSNVDYYVITEEGTLVESTQPCAEVYIDEFDVQKLTDSAILLYIREHYGAHIGVMHEINFRVRPRQFKTQKVLLGLVNP